MADQSGHPDATARHEMLSHLQQASQQTRPADSAESTRNTDKDQGEV